jgi:hypothetical protein
VRVGLEGEGERTLPSVGVGEHADHEPSEHGGLLRPEERPRQRALAQPGRHGRIVASHRATAGPAPSQAVVFVSLLFARRLVHHRHLFHLLDQLAFFFIFVERRIFIFISIFC